MVKGTTIKLGNHKLTIDNDPYTTFLHYMNNILRNNKDLNNIEKACVVILCLISEKMLPMKLDDVFKITKDLRVSLGLHDSNYIRFAARLMNKIGIIQLHDDIIASYGTNLDKQFLLAVSDVNAVLDSVIETTENYLSEDSDNYDEQIFTI